MEYLLIKNWSKFQHYKDRNPPWIKLHFEMLASEDWVMLDDASRVLAIACMLIASRYEGKIPNNPEFIKRVAYLNGSNLPDFKPLINCGFLIPELSLNNNLQASASELEQTQAKFRPETETETETETEYTKPESKLSVPYQEIIDLYHEILPELPQVAKLTNGRKAQIKARWLESEKTQSLEWWREYFETVKDRPFLLGKNDRGWTADIDFLTTQKKFLNIIEGKYK